MIQEEENIWHVRHTCGLTLIENLATTRIYNCKNVDSPAIRLGTSSAQWQNKYWPHWHCTFITPDLWDYNLQLTHKEPDDVRRDLWLARHPGGHSTGPASGVSDPDVLDHDAAVHVREAKVLESATLRLSVARVKLDRAAVGCLPLTRLIALVGVTHQGGSLVCLLQYWGRCRQFEGSWKSSYKAPYKKINPQHETHSLCAAVSEFPGWSPRSWSPDMSSLRCLSPGGWTPGGRTPCPPGAGLARRSLPAQGHRSRHTEAAIGSLSWRRLPRRRGWGSPFPRGQWACCPEPRPRPSSRYWCWCPQWWWRTRPGSLPPPRTATLPHPGPGGRRWPDHTGHHPHWWRSASHPPTPGPRPQSRWPDRAFSRGRLRPLWTRCSEGWPHRQHWRWCAEGAEKLSSRLQ